MNWKQMTAQLLPPIVSSAIARRRSRLVPPAHVRVDEWPEAEEQSWNDAAVADHYRQSWRKFTAELDMAGPLGCAKRQLPDWSDYSVHLKYITFGYVLALASRQQDSVSVLDWGGNLGQYGLIAEKLLHGVKLDYACKEVPVLCEAGRELSPDTTFFAEDAEFAERNFDMVMASGALQYVRAWKQVVQRLLDATSKLLYLTRVPIHQGTTTFPVKQTVQFAGKLHQSYWWCFSRRELLDTICGRGMQLAQEFLVQETSHIRGAGECEMRGFLFRPVEAHSRAA